ncbi:enoyl-CoA delta isomerase 2, mitochondrial [Drosophila subobscura]|uniref:enoyl-CoA delta isomerase 2, mitochondrial n=1 Tax=Drosophila subobscura TaxID=7241 RepID=UPI00155A096E|nr:enoyl-CoA delta isomerase 2, mitochondrial [Drosophila subobscura]
MSICRQCLLCELFKLVFNPSCVVSRRVAMSTAGEDYLFSRQFRELSIRRRAGGLLVIQFQRWQRRTVYELMRALDAANADEDISIVVLSGEFAVGPQGDCQQQPLALEQGKGREKRDEAEDRFIQHRAADFVMRSLAKKLLGFRKLLVAFVQGPCQGLGVSICSLCDLVYATETGHFLLSLSHLHPCVEEGPSWSLPQIELLLRLGERADARCAWGSGFVASLTADAQEFWTRMDQYSRLPTVSLLATKRLLLRPGRDTLLAQLRQEGTPLAAQRRRIAASSKL